MKISLKIFIFTYCIMVAVTILGGFLLINYDYENSLEQAKIGALKDNETLYTYVAVTEDTVGSDSAQYSLNRFIEQMSKGQENAILLGEYEEIEEEISVHDPRSFVNGQYEYSIVSKDDGRFIQVISKYNDKYIVNYSDITEIMDRRDQNYELYRKIIIAVSVVIAAVLYLFSWYVTRPLSKVTKMAERISGGDYAVRIDSSYKNMKSYEVEQLANTLNLLAENTENHIEEIKNEAQKKEDFMGNFSHEMKTPMTSIIGYADLLRTYDLAPEKRREYSNFIYEEGKRVEKLALNLMELIVVEKKEILLKNIQVDELFRHLRTEVYFLGEKYNVKIHFQYETGMIRGEMSLLLAAIKNLIDNACKASKEETDILVQGRVCEKCYEITVKDYGCGIAEDEIQRILEPFYMVDKSRSRKQGGAGLGLSLCSAIIRAHEGNMRIESELKKGTVVTISLKCKEEGSVKDEEI